MPVKGDAKGFREKSGGEELGVLECRSITAVGGAGRLAREVR